MAKKRDFTRLLVMADTHCGHKTGLTPPEWWYQGEFAKGSHSAKIAKIQRELWNFYAGIIDELHPIDRLIFNGDAIDGKGRKTGSSEQATADRVEQCDLAAECINYVKAKKVLMIYGTPYHTGEEEDWEDVVAGKVKNLVKIGSQEWPEINGVVFDVKHKIGASTIPHGRMTALARARLWNQIWHAEHELQPRADVLIRSHVHYHNFCGGDDWIAMTTPALQGFGSHYGARACEGIVHIGLIKFDIFKDGNFKWQLIKARLSQQKAKTLKF